MTAHHTAASGRRGGLAVCILACKDLSLNMRAARQARSLAEAGHRVTVVGFRAPDPRLAGCSGAVTLVATGAPRAAPLMKRPWLRPGAMRDEAGLRRRAEMMVAAGRSHDGLFAAAVATRLAGSSFDVVQAHFDRALIAASALARRCGAKLVFDAVEMPFDDEQLTTAPAARAVRDAEIRQAAGISRTADGWITINDSLADAAVELFGIARPLVLRNFQDAGLWVSDGRLRSDLGLPEEVRILLHLNTMRKGEGLETAIDALACLPSAFHLVGLGPPPKADFLESLRRRAAERGVADRFHLAPMQPPHAVNAYIAGADVGIIARHGKLQNLRLSLPNRLFQMIAARLPVVATPLPEIARVVQDWGLGVLFDEGDRAGLAAAVQRIVEPAARAAFRAAAGRAAGVLTWEKESRAYVRFIENLAAAAPAEVARPRQGSLERLAGG
jgi:glycosyltransferase involved in cell wall biosynthesis